MPQRLRDPQFWLLCAAAVALGIALAHPTATLQRAAYDILLVVDITGSMNARDYVSNDVPISRLERTKLAARELVADLPCRSRLGLAIFTERRSFLLFEPVELCGNFPAIDAAIDALDWRMAWEGDSYVAQGLYSAIDLAHGARADLIFLTDGHEAPPLPTEDATSFAGEKGQVVGLIVGVGGLATVPIPKFDERGHPAGFWSMSDVPQENRSGLPPPDAASRAGYNPRNAPFGGEAAVGTEHLTSVREEHLQKLASITGLSYLRLGDGEDLSSAFVRQSHPRLLRSTTDLGVVPTAVALAMLGLFYAMPLFRRA